MRLTNLTQLPAGQFKLCFRREKRYGMLELQICLASLTENIVNILHTDFTEITSVQQELA